MTKNTQILIIHGAEFAKRIFFAKMAQTQQQRAFQPKTRNFSLCQINHLPTFLRSISQVGRKRLSSI